MNRSRQTERAIVKGLMEKAVADSPLGSFAGDFMREIGSGKMLRARLIIELGAVTGADVRRLRNAAAAVEMIHAASLLHDDVIDGGTLRRGVPAFWVRHGVQGAILFGDMLLFKAIQLVRSIGDEELTGTMIDVAGDVCIAEVEQELVVRGEDPDWNACLSLARRKTGSLFAFSAYAAGTDEDMKAALREAGYLVGTAYQLCDDMLDANGDVALARKSLGSDKRRQKTTAATATPDEHTRVLAHIEMLVSKAAEQLLPWPELHARWKGFGTKVLEPLLASFVGG